MVETCAKELSERALNSEEHLPDIAIRLAVESYLCKIASEYIIDNISSYPDDDSAKKPPRSGSPETQK